MDNTLISEKTFSVPLGFGGFLLTIECGTVDLIAVAADGLNKKDCPHAVTA